LDLQIIQRIVDPKIAEIESPQVFPDNLFEFVLKALKQIGSSASILLKSLSVETLSSEQLRILCDCPEFDWSFIKRNVGRSIADWLFQQSHLEEKFTQYSKETRNEVSGLKQIIENQQTQIATHIQNTHKKLEDQINQLRKGLKDQQTEFQARCNDIQKKLQEQTNGLKKGLADQQTAFHSHINVTQSTLTAQVNEFRKGFTDQQTAFQEHSNATQKQLKVQCDEFQSQLETQQKELQTLLTNRRNEFQEFRMKTAKSVEFFHDAQISANDLSVTLDGRFGPLHGIIDFLTVNRGNVVARKFVEVSSNDPSPQQDNPEFPAMNVTKLFQRNLFSTNGEIESSYIEYKFVGMRIKLKYYSIKPDNRGNSKQSSVGKVTSILFNQI
jgi:hypothetical protein